MQTCALMYTHIHSLCPMTDCFQNKLQLTWFWVGFFFLFSVRLRDVGRPSGNATSCVLTISPTPMSTHTNAPTLGVCAHMRLLIGCAGIWRHTRVSLGMTGMVQLKSYLCLCFLGSFFFSFFFFFLQGTHTCACMYTHSQSKQKTHQNWKMSPKSACTCFTVNLQLFGGQF